MSSVHCSSCRGLQPIKACRKCHSSELCFKGRNKFLIPILIFFLMFGFSQIISGKLKNIHADLCSSSHYLWVAPFDSDFNSKKLLKLPEQQKDDATKQGQRRSTLSFKVIFISWVSSLGDNRPVFKRHTSAAPFGCFLRLFQLNAGVGILVCHLCWFLFLQFSPNSHFWHFVHWGILFKAEKKWWGTREPWKCWRNRALEAKRSRTWAKRVKKQNKLKFNKAKHQLNVKMKN